MALLGKKVAFRNGDKNMTFITEQRYVNGAN